MNHDNQKPGSADLPPLPRAASIMEITDPDDVRRAKLVEGYTAEQYRQGQRDAIAASHRAAYGEVEVLSEALRNIRDYRTDVSPEIAACSMRFYAEQALAAPSLPDVAMPEQIRDYLTGPDLYAFLTNAQNGIDSPATMQSANRLLVRLDKLRELLAAPPAEGSAQVAQDWISVAERLPEDCAVVAIFDPEDVERSVRTAQWLAGSETFESEYGWLAKDEVSHWMPLPQVPRIDGDKQGAQGGGDEHV